MSRLLHAGFRRLFRSRLFWVMAALTAAVSFVTICSSAESFRALTESRIDASLDRYFFELAPYMGLLFGIFTSLFLGPEHADGAIRRRLSVGHTRLHVYLSNYVVCLTAGLIFLALWMLCETPGFFTIGPLRMGAAGFLAYLGVAAGFTASFTAVFLLIGMLCTNRALSVVLSLAVWIGLILAASGLNDRLSELPATGGMAYIDGVFQMIEEAPNPLYVSGAARSVMECLLELLPSGPAILMTDADIAHPFRQMLFAAALTAAVIMAGVRLFERKDIT